MRYVAVHKNQARITAFGSTKPYTEHRTMGREKPSSKFIQRRT